jgi:hypothetical protein
MAAEISLDRRNRAPALMIFARNSAAALAAQDALLDVAYGRCVISAKQRILCAIASGCRQCC